MEDELTGLNNPPRSLANEARGAHLTPDQLVAYHFRQLSEDEAEQAQIHLVKCRECASLLLDLAEFCAPGEDEASQLSPTEFEAAWAELRATLPFPPQPPRPFPPSEPSLLQRLRQLIFSLRPAYALAALSLALSLALAAWIVSLNREKKELIARLNQGEIARDNEAKKEIEEAHRQKDLTQTRVEELEKERDQLRREKEEMRPPIVQIEDLILRQTRSQGETRTPGETRQAFTLEADTTLLVFIIPLPSAEKKYPNYLIEVLNHRTGERVWTEERKKLDSAGGLKIALRRELIPPGEYRFNVYGLDRGGRERILGDVVLIGPGKPR